MRSVINEGAMVEHASVEGMLHLASITVALTIAYLGIDHLHKTDANFQEEIRKTAYQVDEKTKQYNVPFKDGSIEDYMFDFLFPYFVLAEITGRNIKLGKRYFKVFLYAQYHAPLLPYFRNRFDFRFVSALCALSTMLLFFLTSQTEWNFEISDTSLHYVFMFYVLTFTWVTLTVALSFKVRRIAKTCELLLQDLEKRVSDAANTRLETKIGHTDA